MKRFFIAICLLVVSLSIHAQTVDVRIEQILAGMTQEHLKKVPDAVFKPGVAVLKIADNSPLAKAHMVGEAIQAIVETRMKNSLVFALVDRRLTESVLGEIEFAMSGLVDTASFKPGEIRGVDFFLDGSVTELGSDFRFMFRLVSVSTGEVAYTGEGRIPVSEVIAVADQFAAAYVSEFGVGLQILSTLPAAYIMDNEMTRNEGAPNVPLTEFSVGYRITKWLAFETGLDLPGGHFYLGKDSERVQYARSSVQNVNFGTESAGNISYKIIREYSAISMGLGYVWNLTREFNVSFWGHFKFIGFDNSVNITQHYWDFPDRPSGSPATNTRKIMIAANATVFTLGPRIRLQYFINPRLALNLDYQYVFQLGGPKTGGNGDWFSGGDVVQNTWEYYNIDPSRMPDGRSIITDYTGHRFAFGAGVYF